MIRDDITEKLVHLTRADDEKPLQAAERFLTILAERKLRDRTGAKYDGCARICFSEAPLSKLGHILAERSRTYRQSHDYTGLAAGLRAIETQPLFRYSPFGVMVSKRWLFERGGRPAIYQPEADREKLHPDHRFRHVSYEPTDRTVADYSFEREWRYPGEEIELDDNAEVTFIVPKRAWAQWARESLQLRMGRMALIGHGLTTPALAAEARNPPYFIVLEDLGVSFGPVPDPPPIP